MPNHFSRLSQSNHLINELQSCIGFPACFLRIRTLLSHLHCDIYYDRSQTVIVLLITFFLLACQSSFHGPILLLLRITQYLVARLPPSSRRRPVSPYILLAIPVTDSSSLTLECRLHSHRLLLSSSDHIPEESKGETKAPGERQENETMRNGGS